jgi:DNA-binding CsgD family transcriptional regulator
VRALFDEYWARATPLPGREDVSDTDELGDVRVVLELLQLGMKDETIARQLGVSLRTVRRRIAALMDDLGVATRFQAGLEAARRGLI